MEFPGQKYWSGLPFLLQGIFPTLGLNPCLLHCRQILYCWATREALGYHNICLKRWFLNFRMHQNHLEGFISRLLCSTLNFWFSWSAVEPTTCLFYKFPGDAKAAWPRAMLWELHAYAINLIFECEFTATNKRINIWNDKKGNVHKEL